MVFPTGGTGFSFAMEVPNIEMMLGDGLNTYRLHFIVYKTWRNRFRYWMLCQFFPFKIVRWDKETKEKRM